MRKSLFRLREWIADHSDAQYPKQQFIPARPKPSKMEAIAVGANALALSAICLLVGIPLFVLSLGALYVFFKMLFG